MGNFYADLKNGFHVAVKVKGLKGLAESKDQPSRKYALAKYIPHFGSVVGIGTGTKTLRKRLE